MRSRRKSVKGRKRRKSHESLDGVTASKSAGIALSAQQRVLIELILLQTLRMAYWLALKKEERKSRKGKALMRFMFIILGSCFEAQQQEREDSNY